MPRVLVVDDEAGVRESLRMLLHGECEVATAESADQALQRIAEAPPDLILLDLVMPGRSGLELLEELRQLDVRPPVVVLTATKTVTTAVEAMKLGAVDYVTKPFEVDALRIKLRNLLQHRALEAEVEELKDELEGRSRLGKLLGRSAPMRQVYRTIERIASSHVSVLITGESGTGKELVARAVHELGPRARCARGAPARRVPCPRRSRRATGPERRSGPPRGGAGRGGAWRARRWPAGPAARPLRAVAARLRRSRAR